MAVRTTRGGFPGGRPPAGAGMALAAVFLLGGGALVLQNSLFNVDGGHRAIKYKRISGVSTEIYTEGPSVRPAPTPTLTMIPTPRGWRCLTGIDSMVD